MILWTVYIYITHCNQILSKDFILEVSFSFVLSFSLNFPSLFSLLFSLNKHFVFSLLIHCCNLIGLAQIFSWYQSKLDPRV